MTEPARDPRRDPARAPDGLPRRKTPTRRAAVSAPGPAGEPERSALDLARRIVELAEDKKAADIILLDLTGLTTLADAFVICSGGSERQLDAIADGIIEGMRAEKVRPIGLKLPSTASAAIGSTIRALPSLARAAAARLIAPTGSPMSCRQSKKAIRS